MTNLITSATISTKIYTIRGIVIMLDMELADFYEEMAEGEGKL